MIIRTEQIFKSDTNMGSLSGQAIRNGFITITEHVVKLILQIGSTTVLARLILPDSYGLINMVSVVTNFVTMFKDAGLSMATIQKPQIEEREISNLFWINACISIALGVIIMAVSPLISLFYQRGELTIISIMMGFSLMISGMSIQHQALLRRHLQFSAVFVINTTSTVLSVLVTIVLGIMKFEYWALVIGNVSQALSMLLLTFFFCRWCPKRYDKRTNIIAMLKYGMDLTVFEFLNYFTRNLDNLLIGRFCGSEALGLYSKAYQIVYMPINNIRNPINAVAIPIMTKIVSNTTKFREYFQTQVVILSLLIIPLMTCVFIKAHDIILFLFGANWLEMEFVFKTLSLIAIFQPIMGIRGNAMVSLGLSKLYLKTGVIGSIIVVAGFIVGIFFGMNGVAVAYGVSFVLNQFVAFPILFKNTELTLGDLLYGLYPTTLSALTAGIVGFFLDKQFSDMGLFIRIVFCFVMMYAVVFIVMLAIPRGRKQLFFLIRLLYNKLRQAIRKRSVKSQA